MCETYCKHPGKCQGCFGDSPNYSNWKKPKPHKHAAIIKAWADGSEIEVRFKNTSNWLDIKKAFVTESPTWYESAEYRVKLESKPDVVRYLDIRYSEDKGTSVNVYGAKVRDSNIKVVFDGETGKLKSGEKI